MNTQKKKQIVIITLIAIVTAVLLLTYIPYRNTRLTGDTVYVTRTGECYHTISCQYLQKSKIPMDVAEAVYNYRPCSKCYARYYDTDRPIMPFGAYAARMLGAEAVAAIVVMAVYGIVRGKRTQT